MAVCLAAALWVAADGSVSLADRGRARIVNNNVVADNGAPLRGETVIFAIGVTAGLWDLDLMYNQGLWREFRDDFHLNTIRLMLSRPPQNWSGGPGANCGPPTYRCFPLDYVHSNPGGPGDGKTTLEIIDDMVDIAGSLGMYIVIDYHPVGGYDAADAASWWATVAPRYRDRTHVLYEACNEPVKWSASAYGAGDIQFEENLYTQIRAAAPSTHIILWSFGGLDNAEVSKVSQGTDVAYAAASVAYHPYSGGASAITTLRASYPELSTEIGGGSKSEYTTRTNMVEGTGSSWIWLGGAGTSYGVGDNGMSPGEISWPADPGTVPATPPAPPGNVRVQ